MKLISDIFFISIFIVLPILLILSYLHFRKKRHFTTLLICLGFFFINLDSALKLGFVSILKTNTIIFNLLTVFYEIGIFLILIGFGIYVFKKEEE